MVAAWMAGAAAILAWLARRKRRSATATGDADTLDLDDGSAENRRLRRAETVLQRRVGSVVVVLERSTATRDYEAIVRTVECLGIQNVVLIEHPEPAAADGSAGPSTTTLPSAGHGIFKKASRYLTLVRYDSASAFVRAAKKDGLAIWLVHCSSRGSSPGARTSDSVSVQSLARGAIPKR